MGTSNSLFICGLIREFCRNCLYLLRKRDKLVAEFTIR